MATLHRLHCLEIDDGDRSAFLGLCAASASLGLIGAVYLLVTLQRQYTRAGRRLGGRGSFYLSIQQLNIVACLGLCDLLACIGVIIRSVLWMVYNPRNNSYFDNTGSIAWLVIVETIVTGSYIGTFCWSCCYAIDIYSFMTGRSRKLLCYHVMVWALTVSLIVLAMIELFGLTTTRPGSTPHIECNKTVHTVLYDMSFLLPILVTLFFLPIVYSMAAFYTAQFVSGSGRMAETERRSINVLKLKFFLFALAFYVCWFPTVIDLFWLMQGKSDKTYLEVPFRLWMVEAAVNPLQALFNGFLYSKSNFWRHCLMPPEEVHHEDGQDGLYGSLQSRLIPGSMETTPTTNKNGVQEQGHYWKLSYTHHSSTDSLCSRESNEEYETMDQELNLPDAS